jgi:hypothetical protein
MASAERKTVITMKNIFEDKEAMALIQLLKDKGYTSYEVADVMIKLAFKELMRDEPASGHLAYASGEE